MENGIPNHAYVVLRPFAVMEARGDLPPLGDPSKRVQLVVCADATPRERFFPSSYSLNARHDRGVSRRISS